MFLEQVQKICAQKGITIAQLEADVGISRGSVYKWRKHSPSLDVACNVSNYLGVSLDELVGQDFYPSDEHVKKESSTNTPLSGDNFFERFECLLKERGIRAADVSKATGIASSTFTDWKKGRYVPKIDKILLIADFLGVSVDCLIGRGTDADCDSSFSEGVYEKISQLCKANNISVTSLEFELGLGKGLIGKWRKISPNIISLQKVANYFGVSLDYLMAEDGASSKFDSFYTTPEEQAVISAYRACDEMGKGMVRRILNIPDDAYDIAAEVARKELEDTPAKNEELTKKDI